MLIASFSLISCIGLEPNGYGKGLRTWITTDCYVFCGALDSISAEHGMGAQDGLISVFKRVNKLRMRLARYGIFSLFTYSNPVPTCCGTRPLVPH